MSRARGGLPDSVRLLVLGPAAVTVNDREVALPGARERALLAALAARAPRPVPTSRLLEDVWSGGRPDGARTTLRSYVSTLRRALAAEGAGGLVVTCPGGYAIAEQAVERIDARVFSALTREAERHRQAGDRESQATTLRAALDLWRGRAFAEAAEAPGVAPHAARLEEARLTAIELWTEAELACGRHAELLGELAELCAAHPLRERLWTARMLALYRCGRQSEALAAYRRLYERLRDELGIEPGPEVRALELAILRHDPALESATPAPNRSPLPLALRAPSRTEFVGRRGELTDLASCWSLALTGRGQLVLVAGEPGIGKTSLVSHWAERANREGAAVLYGACERDGARPYQPIADALRAFLGSLHGDGADGLLAGRAKRLSPLLGSGSEISAADPQAARELLFEAVADLLADAAAARPLALIVDDLHWADASTLLLLVRLARRLRSAPVLVAGIYRDIEAGAHESLQETLAALQEDPGFTALTLDGLSVGEVSALTAAIGLEAERLGEVVHLATAGNPLFVRQLLTHLQSDPDEYLTPAGGLRREVPLPAGVRSMVERRLGLLPDDAAELMCAAAVIGADFDLHLLEEATDASPGAALAAVEEGERMRLITPAGSGSPERFGFVHDLIRHSLYERLGTARRARLHRRVGELLEARPGADPATLAAHFAAAARPGDTAKAADHAAAAARQAIDGLAFEDARSIAERGLRALDLESVPDRARRCALELLLAEASLFARDVSTCKGAAQRAADDARALGDRGRLVQAAVLGSYLNVVGQPDPATEELCREALTLGQDDPASTALVLAGWADHMAFSRGDGPAAEPLSERALATARRSGDESALARALFIHGEVIGWTARMDERLELADELLSLAHRRDDARAQADAHHQRALALLERGELAAFDAEVAAMEATRPRAAYWYQDMYLSLWRGMRALLDGRLEDVEPLTQALLTHAQHEPNVVNLYLGQLFFFGRAQGRQPDLREAMSAAFDANPGIPGFRCALALTQADVGELEPAAHHLDELARDGFAALPRDATWTMSLAMLSEVAGRTASATHAETLGYLLSPYTGHLIVATKGLACLGAADRYLAMLAAAMGDRARADALFASALELERRTGAQSLVAETEAARAEMSSLRYRRTGERGRPRSAEREVPASRE